MNKLNALKKWLLELLDDIQKILVIGKHNPLNHRTTRIIIKTPEEIKAEIRKLNNGKVWSEPFVLHIKTPEEIKEEIRKLNNGKVW